MGAFKLRDLATSEVFEMNSGDTLGRATATRNFPGSAKISRSHCLFLIENDQLFIQDLNSSNGTFVDDKRVPANQLTALADGAVIKIGDKRFALEAAESAAAPSNVIPIHSEDRPAAKRLKARHPFQFSAKTGDMIMLAAKNMLFTFLTFGLYIPYARTYFRRFLWKSTSLNKTPFMFKGDPKALLKAYLVMMMLFVGVNIAYKQLVIMVGPHLGLTIISKLALLVIWIKMRFNAFAYQVNNTSYRSVFFRVNREVSSRHFKESIKGIVLCLFTMGLYYPFMQSRLEEIKWSSMHYGTLPVRYRASHREYAMLWYKGAILTVLSFGFYMPWFSMSLHRFRISNMSFGKAKFATKANGGDYFLIQLRSMILMMLTMGLAAPYIFNINLTYLINNLTLEGEIDFDQIVQASGRDSSNMDDVVASFFDFDLDVA
jgi:uncharacterized membrane protein YjgN (DUF898 family)